MVEKRFSGRVELCDAASLRGAPTHPTAEGSAPGSRLQLIINLALSYPRSSIIGSLDRVTGDLQATYRMYDEKENKTLTVTGYALQCKPTQRMF